jgi:hypothetical protein
MTGCSSGAVKYRLKERREENMRKKKSTGSRRCGRSGFDSGENAGEADDRSGDLGKAVACTQRFN